MDSLIHKINLDCLRKDSQAIVNAKIGEASGRKIVFTLYEGRAPFFVPSDATVVFRAKKPSGAVLYNNCVVDDGKIEYTITSQTVAEKGVFPCEIQIIGADSKVIYTPCITLNVTENLYSNTEVESSNEFTELENALNRIPPLEVINSKYTKPEGGIPKSDLAQDVQNSLNKADTAQDKLIAGKNITIAADGKTISAINCSDKILSVTITGYTDTEIVADKTYAEIKAAIDSGYPIHTINKSGDTFVPRVNFESTVQRITLAWTERLDSTTWVEVVYEVNTQDSWGVTLREYVTPNEIGNLIALKTQAKDNLVVAINEVKQTTDAKQDKLIAGDNITIAADGKTISATGGSGLTTAQVNALDGMFKVCAFIKDDVSVEYTAFKTAFGITDEPVTPEVTLSSISATYSGGDVAVGTAVTALTGIVVTAHYSDGSTATVTGYTLSGTIAEGNNTITVTYEGLTTTFTVTGVAESTSNIISVTWHGVTQISYTTYELNESANLSMSEIIDVTGIDSIKVTTTSGKWTQCFMNTYASADSDYLTIDGTYGIEGSAGTYIQANSDSRADNSVFDVSNYNYISIRIGTYNATMCRQYITVEKVV